MLALRTFELKDCLHLIHWVPDALFLLQWAGSGYSFPLTTAQLEETFRKSRRGNPDHLMFKAIRETDQETLGHIELMGIDREKKSAHIGRVLICRPEHRGKGYGSRMTGLLADLAFNTLDMRELALTVFDSNRAAIACYARVGFRLSHFQENVRYLDRRWNLVTMTLTREYRISQLELS